MNNIKSSDVLKIQEAANYLGVKRRWIYRRIWNGDLPASKVGGLYFIRRQDIDALIEKGQTGKQAAVEPHTVGENIKCGYCFRLLESDTLIGEVCRTEDCDRLLCDHCLADGNTYCVSHIPDRDALWGQAFDDYKKGKIHLLVKAPQAKLREVSFLGRIQSRLSQIETLRHPHTDESITITDWENNLEIGDDRTDVMRKMNKVVLEADWLNKNPLNAYLRYDLSVDRKMQGGPISILAHAFSPLEDMIQKGFSINPLQTEDISDYLANLSEKAQQESRIIIAILGATTGWDQLIIDEFQKKQVGASFMHHWLLVYLYDMERQQIFYNHTDARLANYAEIFSPILPTENIDEVVKAIETEFGAYDSLTAIHMQQDYPYSLELICKAFEKMASSGSYTLMELPDLGPAIVRS